MRTRRFAYCAELNVRFTSPLRPGQEVTATSELVENRRNKLFEARAELKDATGRVIASATGKYLPIPPDELPELLAELSGDATGLVDLPAKA